MLFDFFYLVQNAWHQDSILLIPSIPVYIFLLFFQNQTPSFFLAPYIFVVMAFVPPVIVLILYHESISYRNQLCTRRLSPR